MIAVRVDDALVCAAGDLADRHRLRAADAIHLASAVRIAEADTAFITFDVRLREAAAAEGFLVLPETVWMPEGDALVRTADGLRPPASRGCPDRWATPER